MASKTTPAAKKIPKDTIWADVTFPNVTGLNLQGQIPMVLAPGKYKTPNLENCPKEGPAWYKDWLINSGFTLKGDHGETIWNRFNYVCTTCSLLIPELDFNNPKMQVLLFFYALGELKDEVGEMKEIIGANKDKALQIGLIGGELIMGKFKSLDDLPPVYPEVQPVFKALFLAAAAARENIPDFLANCKPFVKATDESFIGLAFMALDYILDDNEKLPEDTFKYLHRYESGMAGFFELATLIVGITLPENMRTNILFRRMMELAADILTLTKDLFRVRPDVEKSYGMSLITVKARRMPLKDAFDQTIREITEKTVNFIAACERLRCLYPKNKRLEKFLGVIENVLDGSVYAAAKNTKYGALQVKFVEKKGTSDSVDKLLQSEAVRTSNLDSKSTWR